MSPFNVLLVLVIFGVFVYIVNQIPMVAWMKSIINAVACLFILIWLLQVFGLINGHHFFLR